jgi:uncharacterized OsmC-like protein
MSCTATAGGTGDTPCHEVDVDGRRTLNIDEPVEVGGTDAGPTPHELLAATLASGYSCPVRRAMEVGPPFSEQVRSAPAVRAAGRP